MLCGWLSGLAKPRSRGPGHREQTQLRCRLTRCAAFWQFAFWLRLQGNGRAALPTQFTVCTVKPQGRFLECAPLTVCCVHRHELQRGHSSRLDPQPLRDLGLGRVGWLVESLLLISARCPCEAAKEKSTSYSGGMTTRAVSDWQSGDWSLSFALSRESNRWCE